MQLLKNRFELFYSPLIIYFLIYLSLFLLFQYPFEIINQSLTNFIFKKVFILLIITYAFLLCQYKYGSRFFLPNKWRKKVFEFTHKISEDFDLTKTDITTWPDWSFCLQKLHIPSLIMTNKSLGSLVGKECYNIYFKANDGRIFHYFCLDHIIKTKNYFGYKCNSIDEYDD